MRAEIACEDKVAAVLKGNRTRVARAKRQREVETCILAMGRGDAAMVIGRRQVARQETRRRRHELDQVVDGLVTAGGVLARIVEMHVVDHQALLRNGRHYMRWGQPAAVAGAEEAVRARAHSFLERLEAELQVLLPYHARRARERPRGAIEPVELHSVLNPRHHLT